MELAAASGLVNWAGVSKCRGYNALFLKGWPLGNCVTNLGRQLTG